MSLKISNKIIGYDDEMSFFFNLYNLKKLPSAILINGQSGIGKYTFVLHLLKKIFKFNNDNNDLENYLANHKSIFLLKKKEEENNYKIDEIRKAIEFCKLKSFDNENKFIVIKDINFLNTNCVNALLKILEDSPENTFFIFTNDIMEKCLDTLKSRMFEKKFFLSKNLYSEIIKNYFKENNYQLNDIVSNNFTPGFSLRFLKNFKETCNGDLNFYLLKKNNDSSTYKILSKYMLENNYKYDDFKKLKININFKNDIKNFFKYLK
jgi:DNA polymerase-3 subunit delta'